MVRERDFLGGGETVDNLVQVHIVGLSVRESRSRIGGGGVDRRQLLRRVLRVGVQTWYG